MNEKRPQVLAATLGNTHHHFAIATGMLARYKPQPGGQMPAVFEVGPVANCRYHCGRRFRPDPRILAILWQTSLALKIASIFRSKVLMRSSIWSMKAYKLEKISRIRTVSSSLGVASIFGISRRARVPENRDRYPAVEQESAHLADQCRSMIDQPPLRGVERLTRARQETSLLTALS